MKFYFLNEFDRQVSIEKNLTFILNGWKFAGSFECLRTNQHGFVCFWSTEDESSFDQSRILFEIDFGCKKDFVIWNQIHKVIKD